MTTENPNTGTPERHPSDRLTPADAQRKLEEVLGAIRGRAFKIPKKTPEGPEETPETDLDDTESNDKINYLLGE